MIIEDENTESIKEAIKCKIKEKIKKELLEEIYTELQSEEEELTEDISSKLIQKMPLKHSESSTIKNMHEIPMREMISTKNNGNRVNISITVKAILKIASHSLKYAHSKIPKEKWVEVIGLLAGKMDKDGKLLHVEDAYPMGHGTAVYAEIKDYKNYVRAYKDIKKNKLIICGWYHSHPSYGCFMSDEDLGTQTRYQKLWDKAIALVIDPYLIDGSSLGFEVYRADIKSRKWYSIPYMVRGHLDVRMLPEILQFMNPIIEGKAIYLEYDEI